MVFGRSLYRSVMSMMDEDAAMVAGYMAFAALLALFPFILCIAAAVSFMGTEIQVALAIDYLFDNVPQDVAVTLEPVVREVLAGRKVGFLTFGAAVALYAASNGVEALRHGLSKAYGEDDPRPFWLRRLQSFAFVLAFTVTSIIVSFLLVFGPLIMSTALQYFDIRLSYQIVFNGSRFVVSALLMIGMLAALHRFLPYRRQTFRRIMPGVMLTVVLFLFTATAFSAYLANFADYSVTYGSIAGIVVAMLFFYISSFLFLLGGYFNRHLLEAAKGRTIAEEAAMQEGA